MIKYIFMLLAIDVKYHRHEPFYCKNTSKYPPTSGWNGPKGTVPPEIYARQAHTLGLNNATATIPEFYRNSHILMIFESVFSRRNPYYDRVHLAFP
jgi:hypothetical protein